MITFAKKYDEHLLPKFYGRVCHVPGNMDAWYIGGRRIDGSRSLFIRGGFDISGRATHQIGFA